MVVYSRFGSIDEPTEKNNQIKKDEEATRLLTKLNTKRLAATGKQKSFLTEELHGCFDAVSHLGHPSKQNILKLFCKFFFEIEDATFENASNKLLNRISSFMHQENNHIETISFENLSFLALLKADTDIGLDLKTDSSNVNELAEKALDALLDQSPIGKELLDRLRNNHDRCEKWVKKSFKYLLHNEKLQEKTANLLRQWAQSQDEQLRKIVVNVLDGFVLNLSSPQKTEQLIKNIFSLKNLDPTPISAVLDVVYNLYVLDRAAATKTRFYSGTFSQFPILHQILEEAETAEPDAVKAIARGWANLLQDEKTNKSKKVFFCCASSPLVTATLDVLFDEQNNPEALEQSKKIIKNLHFASNQKTRMAIFDSAPFVKSLDDDLFIQVVNQPQTISEKEEAEFFYHALKKFKPEEKQARSFLWKLLLTDQTQPSIALRMLNGLIIHPDSNVRSFFL